MFYVWLHFYLMRSTILNSTPDTKTIVTSSDQAIATAPSNPSWWFSICEDVRISSFLRILLDISSTSDWISSARQVRLWTNRYHCLICVLRSIYVSRGFFSSKKEQLRPHSSPVRARMILFDLTPQSLSCCVKVDRHISKVHAWKINLLFHVKCANPCYDQPISHEHVTSMTWIGIGVETFNMVWVHPLNIVVLKTL